jgi:hypothetical protein
MKKFLTISLITWVSCYAFYAHGSAEKKQEAELFSEAELSKMKVFDPKTCKKTPVIDLIGKIVFQHSVQKVARENGWRTPKEGSVELMIDPTKSKFSEENNKDITQVRLRELVLIEDEESSEGRYGIICNIKYEYSGNKITSDRSKYPLSDFVRMLYDIQIGKDKAERNLQANDFYVFRLIGDPS